MKLIELLPQPFSQHVEVVHMYEHPHFGQFIRFLDELAAQQPDLNAIPESEVSLGEEEDMIFMNEGEL